MNANLIKSSFLIILIILFASPQAIKAQLESSVLDKKVFLPLVSKPLQLGPVVFTDNFDDEIFTTSNWIQVNGIWQVINGRYVCLANGQSVAGENTWGDYIYEVDVSGVDVVDKIINFRFIQPDQAYGIDFRSNPYNDVVLVKNLPNQNPQILASAPRLNYNDGWYSLKVMLEGTYIKIFVNDGLVINYNDTTSPILYGKIGISAMLSSSPFSRVLFDHVKVTIIEH